MDGADEKTDKPAFIVSPKKGRKLDKQLRKEISIHAQLELAKRFELLSDDAVGLCFLTAVS